MPAIDWDEHYKSGNPPWETGQPSAELRRVVAEERIQPGAAIDLGCGSGINSIWLAQQGFDVTGADSTRSPSTRPASGRSWPARGSSSNGSTCSTSPTASARSPSSSIAVAITRPAATTSGRPCDAREDHRAGIGGTGSSPATRRNRPRRARGRQWSPRRKIRANSARYSRSPALASSASM